MCNLIIQQGEAEGYQPRLYIESTGDDVKAFHKASRYVADLLKKSTPFKIGSGTGPLMHHFK